MTRRNYPSTGLYASLRWQASGAPPSVQGDLIKFKLPRSRIILLVHGYNVSEGEGQKALKGFEDKLKEYSASISSDVAWLMWPGDKMVPVASALSYPLKVINAPRLGLKIAAWLRSLDSPSGGIPEIVLVAHSLGCRVVLETLRELVGVPDIKISVLLMAAAVPVDEVNPRGRLRDAAMRAHSRAVLYSGNDLILKTAFRFGQSVAPGKSFWPEAVGTAGNPQFLWHEAQEMTGFGHSRYWKDEKTVAWFVNWMGQSAPRSVLRKRSISRHGLPKRPSANSRSLSAGARLLEFHYR